MIALLAGLMVLSIAGAALAAPSVDRILDLDLDYGEAQYQYRLYPSDGTAPAYGDPIDFPEDFNLNHGQMLKLIKTQLREGWEGGLGCLVRELAKSDIGKEDLTAVDEYQISLPLSCEKKGDDWVPPGKEKKGEGWLPPGQAKKLLP